MAITFYCGSGLRFAWLIWPALEHKNFGYDFKLMSFSGGDLKKPGFHARAARRAGQGATEKNVGGVEVRGWGGSLHSMPILFESSTTAILKKVQSSALQT